MAGVLTNVLNITGAVSSLKSKPIVSVCSSSSQSMRIGVHTLSEWLSGCHSKCSMISFGSCLLADDSTLEERPFVDLSKFTVSGI